MNIEAQPGDPARSGNTGKTPFDHPGSDDLTADAANSAGVGGSLDRDGATAEQGKPSSVAEPAEGPDSGGMSAAERADLNYFNYMTEVEDEFVRRRGSHLLISPMDWALVESWKDAGVPLHIVMRGISKAFDGYEARANKFRKVNSVLYCQQAVEESYAEYQLSLVGAAAPEAGTEPDPTAGRKRNKKASPEAAGFSKEVLIEFIRKCELELRQAEESLAAGPRQGQAEEQGPPDVQPVASGTGSIEFIARAIARLNEVAKAIEAAPEVDPESVESDLEAIDRMLLDHLGIVCGPAKIEELSSEAEGQLRKYRKNMDKDMYRQTVNNFVARRVRETCHIPRLSLFYMI
ncbi:MAG TPA: hypothetical protein VI756_26655 [Blastocatellia bacterium]